MADVTRSTQETLVLDLLSYGAKPVLPETGLTPFAPQVDPCGILRSSADVRNGVLPLAYTSLSVN